MKHILTTFLVFFLSIMNVFAETTLDFTSDKKQYNIEETINLNISLSTDNVGENQISIEGLDNFEVVGKRQSQSRKTVNRASTTDFSLQLSLLAKKSGDYTLGPISVETGSGKVKSNTLKITVTGERIMVNNKIQNTPSQSGKNDEEEENIDDIDLDNEDDINSSTTEKKIQPRKIIGVGGEEMTDIYRNKGFLSGKLFSKNSLILLLVTTFGLIFYIILRKYLDNNPPSTPKIKEEIKKKPEINYTELIKTLEKKYLNSDKETFYAQTAKLLRTYLDDKVQDGLSKGSLKEVESFLGNISEDTLENKQKIIDFYKKIYFSEYAPGEDNIQGRKDILEQLENIIIRKEFK